jgi:hypothetical protein
MYWRVLIGDQIYWTPPVIGDRDGELLHAETGSLRSKAIIARERPGGTSMEGPSVITPV